MKNNKLKKAIYCSAIYAALIGSSSVLAQGKLLVWEDIQKAVGNKEAVELFEQKYDVDVQVKEIPYGRQVESLRLDGPAGTGPDVILLPNDQIGSAAIQGLLAPINPDKSVLDTFTKSSLDALKYKGQLYGIPKSVETVVMIYNKDLVKELPSTLDGLYTLSKDFVEKGKYGFLAKWDEIYYAYGIVNGMGGDIFGKKDDGSYDPDKVLLNTDGAVKAAEYIQKFYHDGLFPTGILGSNGMSTIDSLFTSKRAAVVLTGPWSFKPYEEAGINYGVAPLPKLPNGKQMGSFMGVKSYSISSYSQSKDLAEKYIEFINTYDNAKRRFELTGEVPAVKKLADDPVLKNNESASAIALQSAHATAMPSIPEMNEVWSPANSALQLIATGKQDPKGALDGAVDAINMQIEANHSMMGD